MTSCGHRNVQWLCNGKIQIPYYKIIMLFSLHLYFCTIYLRYMREIWLSNSVNVAQWKLYVFAATICHLNLNIYRYCRSFLNREMDLITFSHCTNWYIIFDCYMGVEHICSLEWHLISVNGTGGFFFILLMVRLLNGACACACFYFLITMKCVINARH